MSWTLTSVGRRVWHWSRVSGTQPRLLLAAKAAGAAAIAWFLARHVPGAIADYPYYAPLGAVVAMRATVFSGLRDGVQTVVGIVLGVLMANLTMFIGGSGIVGLVIAVGVGVLVSGFRVLGAGGAWAPTAALFVLLTGGTHAEAFSLGYVLQTAMGVAVGVLVNAAVFPPLHFWDADRRIDEVNRVVADHLDGLAAVVSAGNADRQKWDAAQSRLDRAVADVRDRVRAAEESRRVNPRAAIRPTSSRKRLDAEAERFRALERATWYTTDLTEIVARSGPVSDSLGRPAPELAEPLAAALEQVACVIRGDCPEDEGDRAVSRLERAMDEQGGASDVTVTAAATVALRGIVESERRATTAMSDA
jgi:uncharacterized membrane protein YgaE (UPF0421/DUF939 family)